MARAKMSDRDGRWQQVGPGTWRKASDAAVVEVQTILAEVEPAGGEYGKLAPCSYGCSGFDSCPDETFRLVLRESLASFVADGPGGDPDALLCDECRVSLDEIGECPVCHVLHADPCYVCGRRGYHEAGCEESDALQGYLDALLPLSDDERATLALG